MKSKQIFTVAAYGSIMAANHAALDYAALFTRGKYPSHQPPRLWVVWDKETQGYHIEPNLDFVPAKNAAWLEVLERGERCGPFERAMAQHRLNTAFLP